MKKLILEFLGEDDWGNKVFKDQNGKIFKDTSFIEGMKEIYTVCGDFDGEPNVSIKNIEEYKNVEIVITGMENEPTKEEKRNYMMLSRLKMDCEYYLGNGNRYNKHLWAKDEETQIKEMKKIYNWFDEDKKPEWLTWDDILKYEKEMVI